MSVLLAALSLGLFNASKDDIARNFAYVYAFISICVLASILLVKRVHPPDLVIGRFMVTVFINTALA